MRIQTPLRVKSPRLLMTPMIDVVFLLLIFFMVALHLKELDRELPAPLAAGGLSRSAPIPEISIAIQRRQDGQPRITIDGVAAKDWGAVHQVLARLALIPGATRGHLVVVAPADDVPHEWVMGVLDQLNGLRFRRIAFRQ